MATRSPQTLLREYRARRDFSKTTEPQHERSERNDGEALSFVVQKHDASRLHYDFRLEWEGVLKSWAVTKGPSLDPSEKRLAVRTEDHPLSYGTFEGTIPEGEYGGGTVMLWDRGHWEPESDPDEGLRKGKLTFLLHGERLGGKWSLVRMKRDNKSDRENWLLIKADDDAASKNANVLKDHQRSVETKRSFKEIAEASDAMPGWREPQLATLVERAPGGSGWLTEMKYDGYRTLVAIGRESARIFTRNGKDWTNRFPGLASAAAELDTANTLLDGEIVAFNAEGYTDFSTLQKALSSGGQVSCFVFDLLQEEGQDLTDKPLRERKERLEQLLKGHEGPLLYSAHTTDDAGEVLAKLCEAGHEGIIVKKAQGSYRSGRHKSWLKVKCSRRQELVIGGYSPSDKKDRPFASLLLGAYEGKRLVYWGRVGTGFDDETMQELARLFDARARKTSPFGEVPKDIAGSAKYVTPNLVAEIAFAEFTSDGFVRHAVFKGLREDKEARQVVVE